MLKKSIVGLLLVVLAFALISCGSKEVTKAEPKEEVTAVEETTEVPEEEPEKVEEEAKHVKSGTYKIGSDLPAGEYKIFSNGFTYLEVAKDSSGTIDSIITNDNISTFKYVTVEDGQYLQFNNGYAMAVEDIEPYLSSDGFYGEGQYKVGFDIPAGEYNVVADGGFAYIEVAANSTGDIFSIITNDNFDTNKYVTISEGQYFTIIRGKTAIPVVEEMEIIEEPIVVEKEVDPAKAKQFFLDTYHDTLITLDEKSSGMVKLFVDTIEILSDNPELIFTEDALSIFEIGVENYGGYLEAVLSMDDIKYLDDDGQKLWHEIRDEFIDYYGKWQDIYRIYVEGIQNKDLSADDIERSTIMVQDRTEQIKDIIEKYLELTTKYME